MTAVVDLTLWSRAFTASSSVRAACLIKAARARWPIKALSTSFVAMETGSVHVKQPHGGDAGAAILIFMRATTSLGGSVPRSNRGGVNSFFSG